MKRITCLLALVGVLACAQSSYALVYVFHTTLTGAAEVDGDGIPGAGDPDGMGMAELVINSVTNTISWNISIADILTPLSGAHIHNAPAGVNGGVVVNFNASLMGSGVMDPDLADVVANPSNYYVNLHNADYPAGAIRGQLGAPTSVPDSLGAAWGALALGMVVVARRFSGSKSPAA